MAGKPSPVTPSVVEWAVAEDGRTLEELSDALKTDVDTLSRWIKGDDRPTQGQVTELAKVMQRPRALFFLPRPPVQTGLPTTFRHAPGDESRQLGMETRRRVRQARRIQRALSWALRDAPLVDLQTSNLTLRPADVALEVRAWLGIPDDAPRGWGDGYDALRAWRAALESRGVLVFTPELGREGVRGFSAWDDKAPLIAANVSGVSPAARCFTLAHELGHLVTRQDSACVDLPGPASGVAVERWCEEFGAALLMPADAVHRLAQQRRIGRLRATIEDVRSLAATFKVSHRAAALRLIDLGLADRDLYPIVLSVFRPKPAPARAPGDFKQPSRSTARLREYGPHTLEMVLNELPPRDALSMLRVTVEDVRQLADKVPGVPAF